MRNVGSTYTSTKWFSGMNEPTILGGAKAMRVHSGLSKGFWAEAMKTAAHILNRSPHKNLGWKTPHELLFSHTPDICYLKVFGCLALVHISKDEHTKWSANSVQ